MVIMQIVFIHGNGASSDSFNYIKSQFSVFDINVDEFHEFCIDLEYDSDNGFYNNLFTMFEKIKEYDEIFFIGHSLGGLYALHLAHILKDKVIGGVTMGTPYGGSKSALLLNMVCPQQLYNDISPYSKPIIDGKLIKLHPSIDWTAIVTTKGHSKLMMEPNDGVVTIESMYDRKDANFIEVNSTHHEILLSDEAADIIIDKVFQYA
jgi:pimeloyl-ACP methyl ester carboxylesterase